jgi:ATP-dependent helicase/nuclease subunit B
LKPSRLLMSCEPAHLSARVQFLFRPMENGHKPPSAPQELAWQLSPPNLAESFKSISATQFSKYLDCPFLFYLEQQLRMEDFALDKQEMDYRDFGNVAHLALEALARDEALRHSSDAELIEHFLVTHVKNSMQRIYGTELTLPLQLQQRSLELRLGAAAHVLAQEAASGWLVQHVEIRLEALLGEEWKLNDIAVKGVVDRIEYHAERNCWRIIDYKTSQRPLAPEDAHLEIQKKNTPKHLQHLEPAVLITDASITRRWKNLQLPLYAAALAKHTQQPVEVAYLNLPPVLTEVKLLAWENVVQGGYAERAVILAETIIEQIKRGHFWPPNPKPQYGKSFERLLIQPAHVLVDPSRLLVTNPA